MLDAPITGITNSCPSISIVIEWENARLGELGNTRAMLRALHIQLGELGPMLPATPEIVFAYEPSKVSRTLIEENVGAVFSDAVPRATIKIIPGAGLRYYEMKNLGADHASGDVAVLLDSDVVPEPGWLRNLLAPFSDPSISVVAGNSYVAPISVYSRAFALCWMFPLRANDGPLEDWGARLRAHDQKTQDPVAIYANNIAFRRPVFSANKFGNEILFRWHAGPLVRSLARQGYGIVHNPHARIMHPPPPNVRYFLSRALCEGHDVYFSQAMGAAPSQSLLRGGYWYYSHSLREAAREIRTRGRDLGLGPASSAGAFIVAASFASVALAGYLLSSFWPGLIRRHFAV